MAALLKNPLLSMLLALACNPSVSANPNTSSLAMDDLAAMNIDDLLNMTVETASRHSQYAYDAAASINVINKEQIYQRGYRNLVDILEDIPAFEFHTFEDGGGEYPVHGSVRGIGGDPGNTKLLIMIDGIIQNHIAFLWSQGWGEELILDDVQRIEIILGPGSALYGANAVSGVINIITQQKVDTSSSQLNSLVSENNTLGLSGSSKSQWGPWDLIVSAKSYQSDGDMGLGRPDPGSYFHNNTTPNVLTEQYNNGVYDPSPLPANPNANQTLPDGFNTKKELQALRLNLNYFPADEHSFVKQIGLNLSYWDIEQGLGSYTVGYEYYATEEQYKRHSRLFSSNATLKLHWSEQLETASKLWYKMDQQLPDTQLRYTYRFNDMYKSFHSKNSQVGFEQQLTYSPSETAKLSTGLEYIHSSKMEQLASLNGQADANSSSTNNSWDLATIDNTGAPALGQTQAATEKSQYKLAAYAVYEDNIIDNIRYSLGLRHDQSNSSASSQNKRLALIHNLPTISAHSFFDRWVTKLLYGEAFREPSFFELYDEFRGNTQLKPETSQTLQFINQLSQYYSADNRTLESSLYSAELFYSEIEDSIVIQTDTSRSSGESYSNQGHEKVRGLDLRGDWKFDQQLSTFIQYQFLQGANDNQQGWKQISGSARNKWIAGLNMPLLNDSLNINLSAKYYGKRKVSSANTYFSNGYAPSYTKVDMVISFSQLERALSFSKKSHIQLIIDNLLDKDIVGLGRQTGNSNRNQWDPDTNPDPDGFTPPYHPQPGRRVFLQLQLSF